MSSKDSNIPANEPLTLAFDIGGSHLKAGVLSTAGQMVKDRVRIVTPHPAEPEKVVEGLIGLAQQLGHFDGLQSVFLAWFALIRFLPLLTLATSCGMVLSLPASSQRNWASPSAC